MTHDNDNDRRQRSIAAQVKQAQDHTLQIAPITTQTPDFDVAAAYQVADLIHQERLAQGAVAAGRKIGFTNAAMWAKYGVQEPIWGHMYQHSLVHLAGAPGRCDISRLAEPRIEPEIALHFHRAPPADADLATLMDCIDWIAPAFEIVQSHYPGWQFKAADTIADGGLHGMLFVGEAAPLAALGDLEQAQATLAAFTVALVCDDVVRDRGTGANALGNPLAAMAHLLAVLARQQPHRPIQAGEIVTTGTLTAALPVRAGEVWQMKMDGIDLADIALAFSQR